MRTQSADRQTQPSLRDLRLKSGKSLRRTAREAGIDPAHLSRVERGQAQLSVEALARVAKVLGLRGLARQLAPFRDAS